MSSRSISLFTGVDVGALVDSFGTATVPTPAGDVFSMSLKRRSSSVASTIPISEVHQDTPEIALGIREQQTEEGRETGTVSGDVYWKFVKLGELASQRSEFPIRS